MKARPSVMGNIEKKKKKARRTWKRRRILLGPLGIVLEPDIHFWLLNFTVSWGGGECQNRGSIYFHLNKVKSGIEKKESYLIKTVFFSALTI